jgi:hypothetical protein
MTATIQPEEPTDPEYGEHLFYSQMWVKGIALHFIVDRGRQKKLISSEVVKQLGLSTTPHPQPYNIVWLHQGRDLLISHQCRLSYNIHPFKDEVLCDVSPLDVCDVLFVQPYMWKHHATYESQPSSVIVNLGGNIYRILEIVPTTVPPKQCHKVVSHTTKLTSSQSVQKMNMRILQPLQPRPKHLLSNRSRWTRMKQISKIPFAPRHLMYPDLLNKFNPTNNKLMTSFHNATSPARQVVHQDSIAFPSPPGTQPNGYHCFLRRED